MISEPDWPFADPPETEVITLDRILDGSSPILLVTRDNDGDDNDDDVPWQFLDGEHIFEDDARVVLLGEILQFDPTLSALSDLPAGSFAWRVSPANPWTRGQGEPPDVLGER